MFIEGQNDKSICVICIEIVSEKVRKIGKTFTAKHKDFNENYPLDSHLGSLNSYNNLKFEENIFVKRIKLETTYNDVSAAQIISIALADSVIDEEMLQLISLPTTGEDMIRALVNCLKVKNISFDKISSFATDGAQSMVGCHEGLVAILRKSGLFPNFVAYH
ncbi:General transcription factor II-I repeat domain-containing protein 2-like [Oopsacas minuta]|uniref:General transcription factor II-I repeat domain-containing protein 2-like n=1 Tax=Oopsacas minuta TaxID=111878 RepID=A0AAV7JQZ0_9METZ|nr:General transcription factor II-I repeat domain-containing protein 2-like [Oopsacas minuta]